MTGFDRATERRPDGAAFIIATILAARAATTAPTPPMADSGQPCTT